MHEVILL